MASRSSQDTPCCKVSRVLLQHGLDHLNTELERRWRGEDGKSASLRELTREFNRDLLQTVLVDAGLHPVDGEAENLRRIFTDDDVGEDSRIEAKRRLERDGIAVDELLDDFVSHQTIYNHLRNCQDVSPAETTSEEGRLDTVRSTLFGLQSRTETVTEQSLSRLGDHGQLTPSTFDIVVDVQAICEECGRSYGVEQLLSAGGCECTQSDQDQETPS